MSECCLSPGLILSGLYPHVKSLPYLRFDSFSKIGTQSSSVHPGYTVDSYTTISFFFNLMPCPCRYFLFNVIGRTPLILFLPNRALVIAESETLP